MEAIVLAGGLGTRLRSLVDDMPKPMAPVDRRPFLALVLDQLVDAGFRSAVLAVGYRHEAISSYFGVDYRGLSLAYSVENEPLGTGGAIRLACDKVTERDSFVLNGDTYFELDLRAMMEAHASARVELTIAVRHLPDVARYGAVALAGDFVEGFLEKGRSGPGWINGGTYVLGPGVRNRIRSKDAASFSFEHELLMRDVTAIRPLAFRSTGVFIDIGVPEDYVQAQRVLSGRRIP